MTRDELIVKVTDEMVAAYKKCCEMAIKPGAVVDVWDSEVGTVRIGTIVSVDYSNIWRWEEKPIEVLVSIGGESKSVMVRSPNHDVAAGDNYYILSGHGEAIEPDVMAFLPRHWEIGRIVDKIWCDL